MSFKLKDYLKFGEDNNASDVLLQAGSVPFMKIGNEFSGVTESELTDGEMQALAYELYTYAYRQERFELLGTKIKDDDLSFSLGSYSRYRANLYVAQGSLGIAIRILPNAIPDYRSINIPDAVMEVAKYKAGLVIISGVAGSGKTTTLACLVDKINQTRPGHIITLEDPIEYVHQNNKCIITQRDITLDSTDFASALRAALRQAPNVIQIGEMRDYETMKIALTAAETGHLVLATLHTATSALAIDRVVDGFPAEQQSQIRTQLANALDAVVTQRLITGRDGKMYPAFEIVTASTNIKHFIREGATHKIISAMETARKDKLLFSMDEYLIQMVQNNIITQDTALDLAVNQDMVRSRLPQGRRF